MKKDAEARGKRTEKEAAIGTLDQQEDTFSELAALWLESVKLDVKPSTCSDYEIQVRAHLSPYFGTKKIVAITPADVDMYRTVRANEKKPDGTSWSTLRTNKALVTLGAIFRYAVDNE